MCVIDLLAYEFSSDNKLFRMQQTLWQEHVYVEKLMEKRIWPIKSKICLIWFASSSFTPLSWKKTRQTKVPLHCTFVFFFLKRINFWKFQNNVWPRYFPKKISKPFNLENVDRTGACDLISFSLFQFYHLVCDSTEHLITRCCHGTWINTNTSSLSSSSSSNTFTACLSFFSHKR